VPFSLSNYFYGLTAIRFWPYLLTSFVAMLPLVLLLRRKNPRPAPA